MYIHTCTYKLYILKDIYIKDSRNINVMQDINMGHMCVILHFIVATLKRKKKKVKRVSIIYFTYLYIQNSSLLGCN